MIKQEVIGWEFPLLWAGVKEGAVDSSQQQDQHLGECRGAQS